MAKTEPKPSERRKYIRLFAPMEIAYSNLADGKVHSAETRDISPEGMRFRAADKVLKSPDELELKLNIPGAANPVHATGKIVWKEKVTLEDNSPFDFGLEFLEIEEDNKNTFLKFLCDLIYKLPEDKKHAEKKSS